MRLVMLRRSKRGFTLVELTLSIAFIAVLSIIVVVVVMGAISSYRRGLVMNQLNTVGMDLVDDIRSAIRQSPGTSDGNIGWTNGKAGAICTGTYSYVWNSPEGTVKVKIGSNSLDPGRLIKVEDSERSACASTVSNGGTVTIAKDYEFEAPVDLLANNESSLIVYDMNLTRSGSSEKAKNAFYYVSFTLGTNQGGIVSASNCIAPESAGENFDYCAINNFNFAAQAIGS